MEKPMTKRQMARELDRLAAQCALDDIGHDWAIQWNLGYKAQVQMCKRCGSRRKRKPETIWKYGEWMPMRRELLKELIIWTSNYEENKKLEDIPF